jgi:hypothetical protein
LKKLAPKKLALDVQTLRTLTPDQLVVIAGGDGLGSFYRTCRGTCACPTV